MQLFQLEVFCRVVDCHGFTAAAAQLHVTQPAVSHHVRALEEELGVRLLVRHRRTVIPSPAGRILYRHALEITRAKERAVAEIHELRSRPLVLAVSATGLPSYIAGVLRAAGRSEDVILRVDDHDRVLHGVLAGTADVGVVWSPVRTGRLHAEPLGRERFLLVAAPGTPDAAGEVDPAALRGVYFILGRPGSFMRRHAEEWLARVGVEAKAAIEAVSIADMKLAVAGGFGFGLLPAHEVEGELAAGRLRAVACPALEPLLWRDAYLVLPQQRTSPAARELCQLLHRGRPDSSGLAAAAVQP